MEPMIVEVAIVRLKQVVEEVPQKSRRWKQLHPESE
jgi:hypothetical protein